MKKSTLLFLGGALMILAACSPLKQYKKLPKSSKEELEFGTLLRLVSDSTSVNQVATDDQELAKIYNCVTHGPAELGDLSSATELFYYYFTEKHNDEVRAMGYGGAPLIKGDLLVVVDVVQYKNEVCQDMVVRYGVGCRLFLRLSDMKCKTKLDLPYLASAVEMNKATVSYQFQTEGITGPAVLKALPPTSGKFDVDNYVQITTSINKILHLLGNEELIFRGDVVVKPVVLGVKKVDL